MDQMCRLHPKLEPYVKALVSHEIGLMGDKPEVRNIECGSIISRKDPMWGDRFDLKISFCKKIITWQVLMCPHNLHEPPDFIMEDNFLADASVNLILSEVPSLVNWDPTSPECLLNVVLELMQLYKIFQGNLLINRNSRFYLEYDGLVNVLQMPLSDMEVCVHNAARVTFLININVDYSKLPIPLPKNKNLTVLYINLRDNTKNVIHLIKRKELDDVFDEYLNLPELRSDMLIMDYIPVVEKFLQAKVDKLVHKYNQRKLLYSHLLQYFEPAILNGDNITFHNISFLLEFNNSYYVMQIKIPINFPEDRPLLSMSSLAKYKSDPPVSVDLNKYNYDSKWDVEKIFKNLYDYIKKSAISQYNKHNTIEQSKMKK